MKTLAAATIVVALSVTSASAQITMTTSPSQVSAAFGVDPIMRVTSTFRTAVAVTEPQGNPDAKAQEIARRELYGMAAGECAALSEIFQAECRLSSVSTFVPTAPNNAAPPNTMTATAIYELRSGRVGAGR